VRAREFGRRKPVVGPVYGSAASTDDALGSLAT
jgi:hypothetical protein